MNKNNSPGTPEISGFHRRIFDIIDATKTLIHGHQWYWKKGIGIQNNEWRNIKSLFDQTKILLDSLGRTIHAYDSITEGASITDKPSLSGEIGLLERGIVLIYGENGHKSIHDNHLHGFLNQIASRLGGVDATFLELNRGSGLLTQIEFLKKLAIQGNEGDPQAHHRFLIISGKILFDIRSYHTLATVFFERHNDR